MGFLSSLFDFGDKPSTTSSTVVPQYPEELKPNIQEIVDASKTIYDQRLAEGYQPYTGQTIAGFTPEEVASQEGLKSLVGTQGPLQQEALDIARGTDRQFTPEVAQQYMSPYLRTALDAQKAEAQRQYERSQRPQFEAQAVAAGGMSGLGTRAAVESAEREVGQQRLLANIEAAGQQKAFESAQDAFKDQTARERQAAAQISTAAPNIFKSGIAEQGLLQTMGEQKRDLAQSSLDEAYLKYVEQQQFPEQQLARYQSSIYGNPLLKQPSYNTTGTKTGGDPGLGKVLLGLGTTALGFGTGGKSTIGGDIYKKFFKAGGGIGSTMKAQEYMNRNMGGQVMPPIVYQQEGSFGNKIINQLPGFLQDILRSDQPNYRTDDSEASDVAYTKSRRPQIKSPKVAESKADMARLITRMGSNPYGTDDTKTPSKFDIFYKGLLDKKAQEDYSLGTDDTEIPSEFDIFYKGLIDKKAQKEKQGADSFGTDDTETPSKWDILYKGLIDKKAQEKTGKITPPDQSDKSKTAKNKKEPVKVDTSGMPLDVADREPGSDKESLNAMYKAKAANVEKNTMVTIAQKVQEQSGSDGITTIRKAFEKYNKDVRAFIDKDPYRQQKFWATIGAAIMQPGNAFANMAKGFKQAVDGLDASDKKKNELLMALTGKRFDTEVAVGGIQEKRSESLKDRIKDLNVAISKASGEVRKELIKQKGKIVAAERLRNSERSTKLLERTDAEIYDLVKATYSNLSESKRNRLDKKLDQFGGGKAWYQMGNNKKDIADWVRNQINRGKNFNQITGLK